MGWAGLGAGRWGFQSDLLKKAKSNTLILNFWHPKLRELITAAFKGFQMWSDLFSSPQTAPWKMLTTSIKSGWYREGPHTSGALGCVDHREKKRRVHKEAACKDSLLWRFLLPTFWEEKKKIFHWNIHPKPWVECKHKNAIYWTLGCTECASEQKALHGSSTRFYVIPLHSEGEFLSTLDKVVFQLELSLPSLLYSWQMQLTFAYY